MSEKLVLDSFALVSLYHREPGWQVVQRALYDQEKARTRAILSWINWGEFYYIVKRRVGHAKTMDALRLLGAAANRALPRGPTLVQSRSRNQKRACAFLCRRILRCHRPTSGCNRFNQ